MTTRSRSVAITPRRWLLAVVLMLGTLPGGPWAHEGHDHAALPPAPAASEPRFSVASDAVEVTGILRAGVLWCYVNHYDSNAPWSGLRLEVELDGRTVVASAAGEGRYRVDGSGLEQPVAHALVLSLQGEGIQELLAVDWPARTRP